MSETPLQRIRDNPAGQRREESARSVSFRAEEEGANLRVGDVNDGELDGDRIGARAGNN